MKEHNLVTSWSGGKDSCFALMKAIAMGYHPSVLLNVLNEEGKISRSHGIPSAILRAQADAAGLPIQMMESSWKDYEPKFIHALKELKEKYQLTHAVFGDIDLQAHRDWEEKVCAKAGLIALLPLWQQNRKRLVIDMLEAGIETIIVSCNLQMGESYLGKPLTGDLVEELASLGIDPCGENGEYHTLVRNCPLFQTAIQVSVTSTQQHDDYWFCGLSLDN